MFRKDQKKKMQIICLFPTVLGGADDSALTCEVTMIEQMSLKPLHTVALLAGSTPPMLKKTSHMQKKKQSKYYHAFPKLVPSLTFLAHAVIIAFVVEASVVRFTLVLSQVATGTFNKEPRDHRK